MRSCETEETGENKKGKLLKEGHQKFRALKWKFSPKKGSFELVGEHFFRLPPNSAPGLRPWHFESFSLKIKT